MAPRYHSPEEEIGLGPACWMWDYLRRSGAAGFFLPLSGGADSASTAAIVGIMCNLVCDACAAGDEQVLADARRATGQPEGSDWAPPSAQALAGLVMHSAFLGTVNSSTATKDRAAALAEEIGIHHHSVVIDQMVSAVTDVFEDTFGQTPKFELHGGTRAEDIALQNIQARLRMVESYLLINDSSA